MTQNAMMSSITDAEGSSNGSSSSSDRVSRTGDGSGLVTTTIDDYAIMRTLFAKSPSSLRSLAIIEEYVHTPRDITFYILQYIGNPKHNVYVRIILIL
jgi:hypothetical protein